MRAHLSVVVISAHWLLFPLFQTVMIPGPELKPGEEFEGLNYEVPKPKAVQWHK